MGEGVERTHWNGVGEKGFLGGEREREREELLTWGPHRHRQRHRMLFAPLITSLSALPFEHVVHSLFSKDYVAPIISIHARSNTSSFSDTHVVLSSLSLTTFHSIFLNSNFKPLCLLSFGFRFTHKLLLSFQIIIIA